MCTLETLGRLCLPRNVDIDQYFLEVFENIAGVHFLTTVYIQFLYYREI